MKQLLTKCLMVVLLISFFSLGVYQAYCEEKQPLTNADIITMVKGGVGSDLIIRLIESNKTQFDTSAEAILQLKGAGVSEEIIKAMINAKNPEQPKIDLPSKVIVNGFTIEQLSFQTDQSGLRYLTGRLVIGERKLKRIEITVDLIDTNNNIVKTEKASWIPNVNEEDISIDNYWDFKVVAAYQGVVRYLIREVIVEDFHSLAVTLIDGKNRLMMKRCLLKRVGKKDFWGIKNFYLMVEGTDSPLRTKNPLPVFELYIPSSVRANEYVMLVKFNVLSNRREIKTIEVEKGFGIPEDDRTPLIFQGIGHAYGLYHLYRIQLTKPLEAGEYTILLGESLSFDFGVGEPKKQEPEKQEP